MPFRIINCISIDDFAIRPDHHSHAGGFFLVGIFRRAIRYCDRLIDIAEKFAGQPHFFAPFLQIIRRTECDSQYDSILIGKFLGSSTEPIGLLRSIISERAWIEPQHDVFAGMIRQAYLLPVLVGQREAWRHTSDFR